MDDVNPDVSLNHINNSDDLAQDILNAYDITNTLLYSNNYELASPLNSLGQVPTINLDYIKENVDSIYHYHGSCAIGDVVDVSCQVFNVENLYIGDASVLPEPWGGSTSFPSMVAGHIASQTALRNFN
jgi:choline dehydrogenase